MRRWRILPSRLHAAHPLPPGILLSGLCLQRDAMCCRDFLPGGCFEPVAVPGRELLQCGKYIQANCLPANEILPLPEHCCADPLPRYVLLPSLRRQPSDPLLLWKLLPSRPVGADALSGRELLRYRRCQAFTVSCRELLSRQLD